MLWMLLILELLGEARAEEIEPGESQWALSEADEQRAQAEASGRPQDYAHAAILYREYLARFPMAADYAEVQWRLADALFLAGELNSAELEYERLLSTATAHNYGQIALYRLALVRRQQVIDAYHAPAGFPPPAAAVERVAILPSGRARAIYSLDSLHLAYVETVDRLAEVDLREKLAAAQGPAAEELARYADALDADRPALSYECAQIYFNFGQFDEARRRFLAVIDRWPEREEAALSASWVIDSFYAEEDRDNAQKYEILLRASRSPVPPELHAPREAREVPYVQGPVALVDQAEELERAGRHAEAAALRGLAAEAFLKFIQDYPSSQYRKDALYNVAYNYERAGRIDEANAYYKQYVEQWPEDRRSWSLMFRLANGYAAALDLQRAVVYYETLYAQTKGRNYADAPAALYNAGFLRVGLGDHQGAARTFEKYAAELPDLPDAEAVMFAAGAQWERVDPRAAIALYQRYLRRYLYTSPPRALEAHARIATLTASAQEARREWEALLAAYNASLGARSDPASRHLAAMASIHLLEPQIAAFPSPPPPDPTPAAIQALLQARQAELRSLEEKLLQIAALYSDAEATIAALYLAGTLHLAYAEMLASAPIPAAVQPVDRPLYRAALDREHVAPARETGTNRLIAALDASATAGVWTDWSDRAQARLADPDPTKYAPPREEIRGQLAFYPHPAGPVPVRRR